MAHPIDAVLVDAVAPAKADFRSYSKERVRLRVASFSEVRSNDYSEAFGIDVAGKLFDRDTTDTTTADDGDSCVVDFVGTRFKVVAEVTQTSIVTIISQMVTESSLRDYVIANRIPTPKYALVAQPNITPTGLTLTRTGTAYAINASRKLAATAANAIRHNFDPRTGNYLGFMVEPLAATNSALRNRSLTNAIWAKTNITAVKDQIGLDGTANGATRITASAANGTILQSLTSTSSARRLGVYVRRITGTGKLYATYDNGAGWTELKNNLRRGVTSDANEGYDLYTVPAQTLANPTFGLKIETSGDAFAVDFFTLESNVGQIGSPVDVTGTAITRATETATFNISGQLGSGPLTVFVRAYVKTSLAQRHLITLDAGDSAVNHININLSASNRVTASVIVASAAAVTAAPLKRPWKDDWQEIFVALRIKSGELACATSIDDNAITTAVLSGYPAAPTTMRIGRLSGGGGQALVSIKEIMMWDYALDDAQLRLLVHGDPKPIVYLPQNMRATRRKIGSVLAGNAAQVRLAFLGDSDSTNVHSKLTEYLKRDFKKRGYDLGPGYIGLAFPNGEDFNTAKGCADMGEVTIAGTAANWTPDYVSANPVPCLGSIVGSTTGAGGRITITYTGAAACDEAKLFYKVDDNSPAAVIRHSWDGGSNWESNTTLDSPGVKSLGGTIPVGPWVLAIEVVSGTADLAAVRVIDSTSPGVVFDLLANSGGAAADWLVPTAADWSTMFDALGTTCAAIMLGNNDRRTATGNTPDSFADGDLRNLIARIRANVPGTDILLCGLPETSDTLTNQAMQAYVEAQRVLAAELKCTVVDMQFLFGDTVSDYSDVLTDLLHKSYAVGGSIYSRGVMAALDAA